MNNSIKFICVALILSSVLFWNLESVSSTDIEKQNVSSSEEILSIDVIDKKINSLGKTLENIQEKQTQDLANELGITNDQINGKIKALTSLHSAYMNLKEALFDFGEIKSEQKLIMQIYEDFQTKGMTKKPPYSLMYRDSIQAEASNAIKSKQHNLIAIERLKKNSSNYKKQQSQKESELRQLKEEQGMQINPQESFELEVKQLSIQYFKITLQTVERNKRRHEIEVLNSNIRIKQLQEQESYISLNIHYDKSDLEHQLQLIKKNESNTRREIKKIKKGQVVIEKEWIRAQQKMNMAVTEQERIIAQSYLKARDEWRKAYNVVLDLKHFSLRLLERQRIIWQTRYEIVKDKLSFGQKKKIYNEAQKNIITLNQELHTQQNFLINLQKQVAAIENLIQEGESHASIIKYLDIKRNALKKQFERRLEFQSTIIATDQIEQYLLSQFKKDVDQPTVKDQFSEFTQIIKKTWNLEIWVVDENSVSVGKIFMALIILVVGLLLARFFVHFIHKRLLANPQVKDTTASAINKVLSYFVYLMVFLVALRIVNIPLTAFAFLGGAIAIGVGFGAQNLINNFISGFIILGERPIHIGDLIEVDGLLGKVEEIGARCTRVRTGDNIHKLIPNSSIIERNITNWTLSDNRIRTKIVIGVAYGSPVQKVEQALLRATKSNKKILKTPAPFVLFSDFGDNALVFKVYFWVLIRTVLEKKQIESRVRFEIESQFRQEGIVIAFPQRDLHFDTNSPLNIKLIGQTPASAFIDEE
jgi:potassium efflux system protein